MLCNTKGMHPAAEGSLGRLVVNFEEDEPKIDRTQSTLERLNGNIIHRTGTNIDRSDTALESRTLSR